MSDDYSSACSKPTELSIVAHRNNAQDHTQTQRRPVRVLFWAKVYGSAYFWGWKIFFPKFDFVFPRQRINSKS